MGSAALALPLSPAVALPTRLPILSGPRRHIRTTAAQGAAACQVSHVACRCQVDVALQREALLFAQALFNCDGSQSATDSVARTHARTRCSLCLFFTTQLKNSASIAKSYDTRIGSPSIT